MITRNATKQFIRVTIYSGMPPFIRVVRCVTQEKCAVQLVIILQILIEIPFIKFLKLAYYICWIWMKMKAV